MSRPFGAARHMPRRPMLLGAAGLAMASIRSAHAARFPEQTVRYINLFSTRRCYRSALPSLLRDDEHLGG